MKILIASALFLLCGAVSATGGRDVVGMLPDGYCPSLVSDGDLNMLVDWWGGQGTNDHYHLKAEVYRQGASRSLQTGVNAIRSCFKELFDPSAQGELLPGRRNRKICLQELTPKDTRRKRVPS